jgi:hypothetical protein
MRLALIWIEILNRLSRRVRLLPNRLAAAARSAETALQLAGRGGTFAEFPVTTPLRCSSTNGSSDSRRYTR